MMLQRKNKYGNQRVEVDGHLFSSIKESKRYFELVLREKAKEIRKLALQPRFLLQAGFVDVTGVKHRPIFYIADFCYEEKQSDGKWEMIVEDVKGGSATKTEVYRIKKKFFLKKYKLNLKEV